MAEIGVELAALAEGEESFLRAFNRLEALLDGLEDKLEKSLALWEGEDRQAYLEARATWDKAVRELHADLGCLQQAIGRARKNYQSALDANLRMWGGQ